MQFTPCIWEKASEAVQVLKSYFHANVPCN